MISILEPKTDQALSGSFLFNKELASASHGKIERIAIDDSELKRYRNEGIVLLDSSWLYSAEAWHIAKAPQCGYIVHSLPEDPKDWRHTLEDCSQLVATSRPIAERLEKELPDQRIILCEPGIDTRIRPLQPQHREHDLLRLITVANVMPRKGYREAVDFMQALEEQGLAWHWYIVGQPAPDRDFNGHGEVDETYFEELMGQLNEYGWEDDVSFVGGMGKEQQLRLYLNMDVVFFPSRSEDFGLSILEAAQLGLPILTTDVGVARAILGTDSETLIVPAPLSLKSVPEALAFLKRYVGLDRNVRVVREHELLSRSWTKAADDLVRSLLAVN